MINKSLLETGCRRGVVSLRVPISRGEAISGHGDCYKIGER